MRQTDEECQSTRDDEAIERELGALIAHVGQFPTAAQAQVRGLGGMPAAVIKSGRTAEWARFWVAPPATRTPPKAHDWERGEPTDRELRGRPFAFNDWL